jgi:hypothetical protein
MFVCVLCAYYIESELKLLIKSLIWIPCNWQNGLSSPTPNYIWIIIIKKNIVSSYYVLYMDSRLLGKGEEGGGCCPIWDSILAVSSRDWIKQRMFLVWTEINSNQELAAFLFFRFGLATLLQPTDVSASHEQVKPARKYYQSMLCHVIIRP